MPDLSLAQWLVEAACLVAVVALVAWRVRGPRTTRVREVIGARHRIIVRDRGDFRELVFVRADGESEMIQARVSRERPLVSGLPYTDGLHLAAAAATRAPGLPAQALFVGGGALLVPRQLLAWCPDLQLRVAEIDRDVVDLARACFGPADAGDARLEMVVGDGRAALEGCPPESLDVLVVDAFGAGTAPRRLVSAAFFAACHDRLKPGGCLAVNLAGTLAGPRGLALRRVYAGIVETFGPESVAAFGVPLEGEGRRARALLAGARNTVALARRGAPIPDDAELAARCASLPRELLPHLDALLARRTRVDMQGICPWSDPVAGQSEELMVR